MKLQYLVIAAVGFLASASLLLIAINPDEIPYWNYLQELKQQDFGDVCDVSCKDDQENKRGYICVPLDSQQYICRPPRDLFYPDEQIQIRTVFPPTYGEFAYIPDNEEITDNVRLFDIANVSFVDETSKEISVKFEHHLMGKNGHDDDYFEYSNTLHPGDTFVSHCFGGDFEMAHVVEYRDVINIEEQRYFEFWGTHVDMPAELLPCEMPELLHQSLLVDLRLEIDFGDEK